MTARPIRNRTSTSTSPSPIATTACIPAPWASGSRFPIQRSRRTFSCYLPNAAIGWKQPNGFFYPPSFHSSNLFFDKVDIRHYVIDALFKPGGFLEDKAKVKDEYCQPKTLASYPDFFSNFTDIDRQTELNDDDGTLTGLTNNQTARAAGTISVNPADFFNAPVETPECLSNLGVTAALACPPKETPTAVTAKTSPYDYVTTVVFPGCAVGDTGAANGRCGSSIGDTLVSQPPPRFSKNDGRGGIWSQECTNPACYGVPLYRQYLTGVDAGDAANSTGEVKTWYANGCVGDKTTAACRFPFVRMGGQSTYQRSSLTVNHGTFFLDTTASEEQQQYKENFSFVTNCRRHPGQSGLQPTQRERLREGRDLLHVLPLREEDHQADLSDICRPELHLRPHLQGGCADRDAPGDTAGPDLDAGADRQNHRLALRLDGELQQ